MSYLFIAILSIFSVFNVLFALRKILVDILFGIEKWNVKLPDVTTRYIDEI